MTLDPLLRSITPSRRLKVRQRFEEYLPQLDACLQKLYGDQSQYQQFLKSICEEIVQAVQDRDADLQELDELRLDQANWFCKENMLGYCAYVDRFGKNLNGIKEKIPYLQKLGVTYLHLLPFLKTRRGENDGGFAVSSFEEIQPELGSLDDLRKLTCALRKAGISLCSDFILNHVADDHDWALAAQKGDNNFQNFFHLFVDRTFPDQYESNLGQIFPQAAPGNFSFNEPMQKWVWTTFYPFQWDLNYANPQVFLNMVRALLKLANNGIEIFRLDSTAFLWKRLGTNCMNQPEAHTILQALRCIVQIATPAVVLKAEAIVSTADLPAYLGDAKNNIKECHIAYHSSLMASAWMALSEQKVDVIKAVIEHTPKLPNETSWLTYVRCHDDIGWNVLRADVESVSENSKIAKERLQLVSNFYSEQGQGFANGLQFQASDPNSVHGTVGMTASLSGIQGDDLVVNQMAVRRIILLYALAMSFGGLPLIYMGDEIGQLNDSSYLLDKERSHDGRWLQRPFFETEALNRLLLPARDSVAHKIYEGICHLLKVRSGLPAFNAQSSRQLMSFPDSSILGFVRGGFDESVDKEVICLFNFSSENRILDVSEIIFELPENSNINIASIWNIQDLQNKELLQVHPGDTLKLSAYSIMWIYT